MVLIYINLADAIKMERNGDLLDDECLIGRYLIPEHSYILMYGITAVLHGCGAR